MSALIAAVQLPAQQILPETDRVLQELKLLANAKDNLTKWRFIVTIHMVPAVRGVIATDLQLLALRDIIDLGIAARRYSAANARLPETNSDLEPKYIPRWPIDPFTGRPMETLVEGQCWHTFSIDDAGTVALRRGVESEDNIRLSLKFCMPTVHERLTP